MQGDPERIHVRKWRGKIVGIGVGETAVWDVDDTLEIDLTENDLQRFRMMDWPTEVAFTVTMDGTVYLSGSISRIADSAAIATDMIVGADSPDDSDALRFANSIGLAISMEEARVGDVKFTGLENLGDAILVKHEITTSAEGSGWDVYGRLRARQDALFSLAQRMSEGGPLSAESLAAEETYTTQVLLPLFRFLGLQDVRYAHGQDEYGRDITFSEIACLGLKRNYGVQVKAGDLSGEAGSQLDKIIAQIADAFAMPYVDVCSRERRYITDMIIAISGHYTHNAKEKIIEKVGLRNVYFLDIDKVTELVTGVSGKPQDRKTNK